jgi:hypothetical protein
VADDNSRVSTPPVEERPRHVTRKVTYEVEATPLGASARDFVFAKSDEWSADPEKKQITPGPPGTWGFIQNLGIVTRCPKCKKTSLLHPDISKVLPDGRIDPDLRCMTPKCGFARRAYLDKAWGKTLYCVAVFNRRKQARKKDPREFHFAVGNSQQEAMTQVILEPDCTVIAVGPAVGFKVTDKHGEKLIAEG